MSPSDPRRPPPLDELLAHASWMRTLARSLLVDPAEAEEVVQDAWVVALRERAAVRVDLASWLRTVVRNLALRRAGRERRRPAVEQRAARSEATSVDAPAAIERMELQRWLAEALLALDEPYRTAVILRHVEGLDAGAIGRAQGCTPEAARQRVARGLDRLRGRLDAEQGGRERWALLLAAYRSSAAPLGTVSTVGGIALGTKIVLGSLVVAVAAMLLWLERGRAADAPASGESRRLAAAPLDEPDAPRSAVETPALAPETREAAVTAAPEAARDAAPADPLTSVLSGRVVDVRATPISGAEVVVKRPAAGHLSMLDLAERRAAAVVGRTVTGADGSFSFALERGIPFDLSVAAAGFCDEVLQKRPAGEELEIVLTPGYLVHGFVTRERDGAPIADAEVTVFHIGGSVDARSTRTAADGSYRLRFSFARDVKLEVLPLREMGSEWLDVQPGPDGTVRMDVALGDGVEVRGRVVEAGTGEPIEGAVIGEGWTFDRSVTADARGEYRLPGFGRQGVMELECRARGFGKAQCTRLPAAVEGVMRVDFELPRGRIARGRVLDASATPVANAYVAAVASRFDESGQLTDWISGRTDARGRFELDSLTPELIHALLVTADGLATQVVDFPTSEPFEREIDLGDIALSEPGFVSGTVQDEHGNPFADVEVVLTGTNADRGRLRPETTLPRGGDWYVDTRIAPTDARGCIRFGALPAGDFVLQARKRGWSDAPKQALHLAAREVRESLAVILPAGEALRGTVVDEAGRGLRGVYVTAVLVRSRGEVQPSADTSSVTDADGAFELRGLPSGRYRLDVRPWELEGDPEFPWLATELEAESGGEPLRIQLQRGTSIRGRLVDEQGAAIVGYWVSAGSPQHRSDTTTGDDGGFQLEARFGEVYELQVLGPVAGEYQQLTPIHVEPGIAAGARDVLLRVDPSPASRSDD